MRTPLFAVIVALSLMLCTRTVRADTFHLPCDPSAAISAGGGWFKGNTSADSVGDISFERWMIGMPRLELTLFDNCVGDTDEPRVTRRWFGRINIFGAAAREQTSLSLVNKPGMVVVKDEDGNPVRDADGNILMTTEDTLTEADLDGGSAYTYTAGARVSVMDAAHFHVEAFVEHMRMFGWKEGEALRVMANVNDTSLDVTGLVGEHADVMYRYSMTNYGLTLGVPLRKNTIPNWRFTPYLTIGRTHISADVEARIHPDFVGTVEAFGVDPSYISKRRSVRKSSWSGLGGVRADVRRNFSFEGSFSYGKTAKTTITVVMITATLRFDLSSLRALGKDSITFGSMPF